MLKVLYNFFIKIFYIPYCFIIFIRKFYKKEHKIKFKEKIFFNKIERPKGFLFWFHAASIGELNSILPIVDYFLKKNTGYNFLITTVTLSSFSQFQKKYKDNRRVFHQFLPYDSNLLINNFFKNWKPDLISFVDSEIWPNFFLKIRKEKLPFLLLNGRITKKTFKRWKILKSFASELFGSISLSIASNKETVKNLNYFDVKNVKFFGNIKFCSPLDSDKNPYQDTPLNVDVKKKIWCAISTHEGEEIFCGKVHQIIKKTYNNIMTIIIPRHIERTEKIFFDLKKMGLKVQIKNENENIDNDSDIVLVNYYGSVSKYLKKFRQVFIGKSLLKKLQKDGGQNPIDAAKIGCNIFHGPFVSNFKEIYDYLDDQKFSQEIYESNELAEKLIKNFSIKEETKNEKQDRLIEYSNSIFKNIIKEYESFIK